MPPTGKGVVLSTSSIKVLQANVDEVKRLKETVKQVERANNTLPIEIFVPRSEEDDIYTGDLYVYDPETEALTLQLEDQTAELLPDEIAP